MQTLEHLSQDSQQYRTYSSSMEDSEDDSSKSSDSVPHNNVDLEKVPSGRRGSAVFQPTMSEDSSYKTLNRYQASLIYITNQVGLGILSLPSALQTLGLVPGIIAIVGLGDYLYTFTPTNVSLTRICRCPGHIYRIRPTAVLPKIPDCSQLRGLLSHHRRQTTGYRCWSCFRYQSYTNMCFLGTYDEHRAEQHFRTRFMYHFVRPVSNTNLVAGVSSAENAFHGRFWEYDHILHAR